MPDIREMVLGLEGQPIVTFETMVLLLVFLMVFFLVIGIAAVGRPDPLDARLSGAKAKGNEATRSSLRYGASPQMARLLDPLLRAVPVDERELSTGRRRLVQAGYYDPKSVHIYYALRVVLALALPPAALLVASLALVNATPQQLLLIGLGSAAVGFYLPMLFVVNRAQKRQQAVREGFPDALDLLLVCVEAGLSLDAAVNRVAMEIHRAHPVLGEQLRLVALEFQAGKTRGEALRNFAERTGVEDVKSLVTLLVHSDRLGTSMAQSLRIHAVEMRSKRLLRAEEIANKIPVKMVIPLGMFFLPCLMTVIMTPMIIRVARTLIPALGG